MRRRSLTAVAAVAVALAGSTIAAGPASASARNFHSPSGNIGCELGFKRPGIGTYAYCQTVVPARSVRMSAAGKLKRCNGRGCIGDGPEDATTLAYGHSITLGPFRCTSRKTGMRCIVVKSGAGFVISKAGIVSV